MLTSVVGFIRGHYFLASILATAVLLTASVTLADIVSGSFDTSPSSDVTTTLVTIDKPISVAQGNLLLANIAINGGSPATITAPSGWTQILRTDNDTSISIVSYYKVAGVSEPGDYTWSISPQTRAIGGITQYSGVDASNPIDTSAGNFGLSDVATTSSITTSSANEEVVTFFATDVGKNSDAGAYFSTPTGMTEKYDVSNVTLGPSTASDDAIQVAAGVSGSKSSTISGNKARNWASQQIALRSVVPAPPIILDTLPTSVRHAPAGGESFTYTVPSGSNRVLVFISFAESGSPTLSYNGVAPDAVNYYGVQARAYDSSAYCINPPAGPHTFVTDLRGDYILFTVGGVDQAAPIAANSVKNNTGVTSASDNLTTTSGSSLLLVQALFINAPDTDVTFGTDQTEITHSLDTDSIINPLWASFKPVANSSGSETMNESWSGSHQYDLITLALRSAN